jgi:hypothetical protein
MDKMPRLEVRSEQEELTDLARRINEAHVAGIQGYRRSVHFFREAGEALLVAKAAVGHGNFADWRKTNCPAVNERTAQRYMLLAKATFTSDSELVAEWKRISGNAQNGSPTPEHPKPSPRTKAPPEPPPSLVTNSDPEGEKLSDIRQVSLRFSSEAQRNYQAIVDELEGLLNTTNEADTVLEGLKVALKVSRESKRRAQRWEVPVA